MEVILLERIEKLGKIGDSVRVKDGFARNFLLPNKKALRATKEARAFFEAEREKFEKQNADALVIAQSQHEKVNDKTWTLIRQASETGQLYGSVKAQDIVSALAEVDCPIQRSQVMISNVIKTLGIHEARVRLHPEVVAKVQLNVARSEEDAAGQLAALSAEEQAEELNKAAENLFDEGAAPTEMAQQIEEENQAPEAPEAPAPAEKEIETAPPMNNVDNLNSSNTKPNE